MARRDAFPPHDRLDAVLRSEGLPSVIAVRALPGPGPVVRHLLSFEGRDDLVLHRVAWDAGHDPLQHELAAVVLLQGSDLPVSADLRYLPHAAFDGPAALTRAPRGVPGDVLLRNRPDLTPAVLTELGSVIRRLNDLVAGRFATRADAGTFVPARTTWRSEWAALLDREEELARVCGVWDLPVARALAERARSGLAALPDAVVPCLVHGGLRPDAAWFAERDGRPELTAVTDWTRSIVGDPHVEWARMLRLPDPLLQLVATGADVDPDALVDAAGPIATYAAAQGLSGLRDAGQRAIHEPGASSGAGLVKAVRVAEGLVAMDVRARLESAVGRRAASPHVLVEPRATDAVVHRVAHRLGLSPGWSFQEAGHLLGALVSAELAAGIGSEHAAAFTAKGHAFLDATGSGRRRTGVAAIPDRPAWRAALCGQLRAGAGEGPALAVACLERALSAFDDAPGEIGDDALRGLEALLLATSAREADVRGGGSLPAPARLGHGILGRDAAVRLGWPEVAAAFEEQARDAADALGVRVGPDPGFALGPWVAALAEPMVYGGGTLLVMPVALALTRWESPPAPRAALLEAAFKGG